MRLRTGDTNTSPDYFLTDAQWTSIIKTALKKLKRYYQKQVEYIQTADGINMQFTLPDALKAGDFNRVTLRTQDNLTFDIPFKGWRINNGIIYTDVLLNNQQKIVFWYKTPYVIDTDTFPEDPLEMLYMLSTLGYVQYAMFARADFEQWASQQRSDTSINQLAILAAECRQQIKEARLGEGSDALEMGNY
jgi:hypothetical protein